MKKRAKNGGVVGQKARAFARRLQHQLTQSLAWMQ